MPAGSRRRGHRRRQDRPTRLSRRDPETPARRHRVAEVALVFGRLSLTAFGGPAAHIAMMRRELVEQRGWLTDGEFLDLIGASNVIPGPTSTEVAMYVGRRRAGVAGFLAAGLAFITPAAAVMGILAWAYVRYGTRPAVVDLFDGVKPVVVAIVLTAVIPLGRAAVKRPVLAIIGATVLVAYLAGINEPVLLLAAAATAAAIGQGRTRPGFPAVVVPLALGSAAAHHPLSDPDLPRIFAVFFKIGALLFGSGYVLLAFLRRDLVVSRHWLTEAQLLDAIAVGQFTPGPLFTTATFVGYLLGGIAGALVATVAIFLPAFLFVAAMEPILIRLRRSPTASAALDGLNVAAVALMLGVTWSLASDAIVDVPTALIAVAALAVLVRWRVNPAWLVAAGALCGLALG